MSTHPPRREPTDFLCLAMSPEGYLCNRPPKHRGEHIAEADDGDGGRVECARWTVYSGSSHPSGAATGEGER